MALPRTDLSGLQNLLPKGASTNYQYNLATSSTPKPKGGANAGNIISAVAGIAAPILNTALTGLTNNNESSDQAELDKLIYGDPTGSVFGQAFNNLTGQTTKQIQSYLDKQHYTPSGSTMEDLASDWSNINFFDKYKEGNSGWGSVLGTAVGAPWLNIGLDGKDTEIDTGNLRAGLEGIQMGSAAGPWGIVGGAILGDWVSKINNFAFNKNVQTANAAIEEANKRMAREYNTAVDNTIKSNNLDMMRHFSALGGPIFNEFNNGLTFINNGGNHEENPNEGIQMGIAPDGKPNLVEEGEVIWNDYVFSKRLTLDKDMAESLKLKKGITFADAAKKIQKESEERPNDPISNRGLNAGLTNLMMLQEMVRQQPEETIFAQGGGIHIKPSHKGLFTAKAKRAGMGVQEFAKHVLANKEDYPASTRKQANFARNASHWHWDGDFLQNTPFDITSQIMAGIDNLPWYQKILTNPDIQRINNNVTSSLNVTPQSTKPQEATTPKTKNLSWLRYAEPIANIAAVLSDAFGITNKPTVFDEAPIYTPVSYRPVSNYLQYNPFDTRYALNTQQAQQAGLLRGLADTSSPSRNAAILAANYQGQNAIGNIYRQAQEYNAAERARVAEFNRATDQFNSQLGLQTDQANRAGFLDYARTRLQQQQMTDAASNQSWGARAQNIGALASSIANIGREQDAYNWRDMLLRSGAFGVLSEKPSNWSDKDWQQYKDNIVSAAKNFSAKGGKINKKKRGLTY